LARLRALGAPFETDTTPGGELRQAYVIDPNGVGIEFKHIRRFWTKAAAHLIMASVV
jgi:hypothetical protein